MVGDSDVCQFYVNPCMWLGSSASGCRPLQVDTPPRPALPADHGLNGSMHKTSSLAKLREAGHAAVYRAAGGNRELVGLWLFVLSTFFGTGMSLCAKLLGKGGEYGATKEWGSCNFGC